MIRKNTFISSVVFGAFLFGPVADAKEKISIGPVALPRPATGNESQCGDVYDAQHVSYYEQKGIKPTREFIDGVEKSTVQIQWRSDLDKRFNDHGYSPGNVAGVRWCSGTLISPDLVLTAGHCFSPNSKYWDLPKTGPRLKSLTAAEITKEMVVNFNYQFKPNFPNPDPTNSSHIQKTDVFKIAELVEYSTSEGLDYAIISLARDKNGNLPSANHPIMKLDFSKLVLKKSTYLTIVQHPKGQLKQVDSGRLNQLLDPYILYNNLDTLGGSSGAGILNEDGVLIGVHTNGGCDAYAQTNAGISLVAISQKSKTLRELSQ